MIWPCTVLEVTTTQIPRSSRDINTGLPSRHSVGPIGVNGSEGDVSVMMKILRTVAPSSARQRLAPLPGTTFPTWEHSKVVEEDRHHVRIVRREVEVHQLK